MLVLEGAQAGLSWITILRKREAYRSAFDSFDPRKISAYGEHRVRRLLDNPGIIRNALKVRAAVVNARAFLRVVEETGSFDRYIWRFTGGKTLQNAWRDSREVPALTAESTAMSRDLKKRGFRFVGPTICYAYMQAVGMVNDHVISCFRHEEIGAL